MYVPVPNPEAAPRPELEQALGLPGWSSATGASERRGPRIAGASLFLIFFATLPLVWVTLSYDCGPSEDVTGIQLLTGEDIAIKGSQSNVMIGYDETPIDGTYRQHPSFRMILLLAIIGGAFASIFLSDGGYSLRAIIGTLAALVALSFVAGSAGRWEGIGPPPSSEGAFGPFAAFVVFVFAAAVNGRMAHLLDDTAAPRNVLMRATVYGLAATFLITVVVFGLILLIAVLTYEG